MCGLAVLRNRDGLRHSKGGPASLSSRCSGKVSHVLGSRSRISRWLSMVDASYRGCTLLTYERVRILPTLDYPCPSVWWSAFHVVL